ncbi:MAG: hypothetical protein M3391_03400 [Actinomycetota bacterium]|nr:hypothetical protein [Actinomycetota bacterium]
MPVARVVVACFVLVLVAVGCRSDEVSLTYEYEVGQTLTYLVEATAHAEWDIGGTGEGSYRWVAEVFERVEEVDDEGALVEVTLAPTDVEEEGLLSPGSDDKTFSIRIDDKGRVLEVIEIDGVPAEDLDPEEVAFIGTYRPPLPTDAIRLREEWAAPPPPITEEGFQQLVSFVELDRLDRDVDGRTASISYSGESPLTRTTTLPEGDAELAGSASISGEAIVDLDGGFLRESTTTTEGDFEVRALPSDEGSPLSGSLHQVLELHLERI